ncbi:hypothetical protein ACKUSY_03165 [Myroides odoratus]
MGKSSILTRLSKERTTKSKEQKPNNKKGNGRTEMRKSSIWTRLSKERTTNNKERRANNKERTTKNKKANNKHQRTLLFQGFNALFRESIKVFYLLKC